VLAHTSTLPSGQPLEEFCKRTCFFALCEIEEWTGNADREWGVCVCVCVCVKDGGVLAGFGCPRHQVAATHCNTHATHCITLQLTHQEQDAHACSHSKHHPS